MEPSFQRASAAGSAHGIPGGRQAHARLAQLEDSGQGRGGRKGRILTVREGTPQSNRRLNHGSTGRVISTNGGGIPPSPHSPPTKKKNKTGQGRRDGRREVPRALLGNVRREFHMWRKGHLATGVSAATARPALPRIHGEDGDQRGAEVAMAPGTSALDIFLEGWRFLF